MENQMRFATFELDSCARRGYNLVNFFREIRYHVHDIILAGE